MTVKYPSPSLVVVEVPVHVSIGLLDVCVPPVFITSVGRVHCFHRLLELETAFSLSTLIVRFKTMIPSPIVDVSYQSLPSSPAPPLLSELCRSLTLPCTSFGRVRTSLGEFVACTSLGRGRTSLGRVVYYGCQCLFMWPEGSKDQFASRFFLLLRTNELVSLK